jgi:DNA invertase Pin-like site-specific DNA recombinase
MSRIDVVFIRKSTKTQDEKAQQDNVRNMLKEKGVEVPEQYRFTGTVSRRKVKANAEFNRLMELVEADRVGTVYVESQDRWGTGDRPELFSLIGILRQHDTKLYDLRAGKDLTENDIATEMLAFIGSIKSEKELQDISYRSLRTRLNNFKDSGTWPTGTHPYGYGKACYGPNGDILWVWQPVNRSEGQIFYPGPNGLTAGPSNVSIPRKDKQQITKLVPSNNPAYVTAVKLTFDLFVRVGLSRRQISARLNKEGLLFNGGPFTHPDVTNILRNPAYVGDTHFGKVQTGELNTFDANGLIVEVRKKPKAKRRNPDECLVRRDTHEALVDRKTWEFAQKKLEAERERKSYSPRNPAYWLKQLFVCGHCGKGLTGRTERDRATGRKTVVYVCSTYAAGRCNGLPASCGYQRITHDEAECLLLDKIKELNLPFDNTTSEEARENLQARLARLGHEDAEAVKRWEISLHEGIDAFAAYLSESYGVDYPALPKLRKWALEFYCGDDVGARLLSRLHRDLADLRSTIQRAEKLAVEEAQRQINLLEEEHRRYTLSWAKASELQQAVLKPEIDRLEADIRQWKSRTVPLSSRLEALYREEAERQAEREKLLAEWPTL